jgi:superfamily II DNA/RNA helicase
LDFSSFDFHPDLLDSIDALNYKSATPIQEQAIPIIMEGRDIIGTAQTGTGKTAAFLLPVIDYIVRSGESGYVQALIIVPTRELAQQIDKAISAFSYFTGISSVAVYGGGDGKSFAQEKTALSGGADIVVATPGRLIAHINLGYVNFSDIQFLVLDEADRMLDMGFKPDLLKIIRIINPNRQSLLFSATMPDGVLKLGRSLTKNAATVSIALSKPAEGVSQSAYLVKEDLKLDLVQELLRDAQGQRILIFGSTKQSVSRLYQKLKSKNMNVGTISSDIEQDQREQVMLDYRNGKLDILVATDVLSRGIHVDGIDLVINYDVPHDAEDYVHRIGRTARAASIGAAITLVSSKDMVKLKRIEKLIGKPVPKIPVPERMMPKEERRARPAADAKSSEKTENRDSRASFKGERNRNTPAGPTKQGAENKPNSEGAKKKRNRWKKKKSVTFLCVYFFRNFFTFIAKVFHPLTSGLRLWRTRL